MTIWTFVVKSYTLSPIWTLYPLSISKGFPFHDISGFSRILKKSIVLFIPSYVFCNDVSYTKLSDEWLSIFGRAGVRTFFVSLSEPVILNTFSKFLVDTFTSLNFWVKGLKVSANYSIWICVKRLYLTLSALWFFSLFW